MSPPPHIPEGKLNMPEMTPPQPNNPSLTIPLALLSSQLGSTSTAVAIVVLAGVSIQSESKAVLLFATITIIVVIVMYYLI